MPSLYDDLRAAGCVIENHESDLHTPATPEARAIIHKHPGAIISYFRCNITVATWIEVPFAYDPFWSKQSVGS